MEFTFETSEKYERSTFAHKTIVFSKPIITIQSNNTIKAGEPYRVTFTLTEDNVKVPISKAILIVYIDGVPQIQLITDEQGRAVFDGVFPKGAEFIQITATYNGSVNEYYTDSEGELILKPVKTKEESDYYSTIGQYWYVLALIIAIMIILSVLYWWRKHRLFVVKSILSDISSKLETKDKSRRIIYETYLKMLELMRRLGIIRAESETPREFTYTIKKEIPEINTKHLSSLTSLFEEARYSKHRIGKPKRTRAVRNLKHVRKSIETEST